MGDSIGLQKQQLRDHLRRKRAHLADRPGLSRLIHQRLTSWLQRQSHQRIAIYIGVRDEVETRPIILERLQAEADGRSDSLTLVPYCVEDGLELFRLENWDDLQTGQFGVPEPNESLRRDAGRSFPTAAVDLFVVPGVGFDPTGRRLGYGGGYFDRLLSGRSKTSIVVGLAFDCQLVSELPDQPHDERVEWIMTETRLIDCQNDSLHDPATD